MQYASTTIRQGNAARHNQTHEVPAMTAAYTARQSRRGDFIVLHPYNPSLVTDRAATAEEAADIVARLNADLAAEREVRQQRAARRDAFLAAHPGLFARQIAWQQSRNDVYAELGREHERLQSEARAVCRRNDFATARPVTRMEDRAPGRLALAYADEIARAAEVSPRVADLARRLAEADGRYGEIVAADSATKAAIRETDAEGWALALDAAEALVTVTA